MANRVEVTYTAYERGTSNVISEGTVPIPGSNCWTAEETIKAMFTGLDVVIRTSRVAND